MRGRTINATIETRKARGRLRPHKVGHFRNIAPGVSLGYRKLQNDSAGTWVARWRVGDRYRVENLRDRNGRIVVADDFAEADGAGVLSYGQALDAVRATVKTAGLSTDAEPLQTVDEALTSYRERLIRKGKKSANADHVRYHLPAKLAALVVARLTERDFAEWISSPSKADLAAGTVNRLNRIFKAALNSAANSDPRIERRVWTRALEQLPDAAKARNIILDQKHIIGLVNSAYEHSSEFGRFVEVLAQTGARPSEAMQLTVADLKMGKAPRLQMLRSKKGTGEKKIKSRPVPITLELALKLQASAKGKPAGALLLPKENGVPWGQLYSRPFRDTVKRYCASAKIPAMSVVTNATIYALRHSSIVRQITKNVPIRVIAVTHDTSVPMIETHYSAELGDHTDDLTREVLLDTSSNVVAMVRP